MTTSSRKHLLLAIMFFCHLPLLLLLSSCNAASLIRRDEHEHVVPLTYDANSNLMTASISIGSFGSSYNLIVDTGSPFLLVQNSSFHTSPSTWDPQNAEQPDLGGGGGFMFTTPDGKPDQSAKNGKVKPTMHFVTDVAWLNEASGERAGAGAKKGNVTVGLAQLNELKDAQGILGLSPPFSLVGAGKKAGQQPPAGGPAPQQAAGGASQPPANGASPQAPPGGKTKRWVQDDKHHTPPPSKGGKGKLPSLDVSFLHSYLSPDNRKTLGITGSSHFYLDFSASTLDSPTPTGEIVFPLTGTTLPTSTSGYNYSASITIDASSGSTYPAHPFWGIAHRTDLRFFLNADVVPDVQIDALLIDSGTSGIIAPPSEVQKIYAAAGKRITTAPQLDASAGVVLGKAKCSDDLRMGFEIGTGKRAQFEVVRRTAQSGKFSETQHDATRHVDDWSKRSLTGLAWKSYRDPTLAKVSSTVSSLSGLLNRLVKRHKRQLVQIGIALNPDAGRDTDDEKSCQVSLMGSPQVEQMFPSNGPNFKVWILGMEFFQSNLVYHNLDTSVTQIVPRNTPADGA